MRFRHRLLAWCTTWHRHVCWLETLWSPLVLRLKLWLSTAGHRHHLGASCHWHLKVWSLRWARIVALPLLLHILSLWLLICVSLVIAATHVVVILVRSILVVHILAAVTLPVLLRLILLHHRVVGPISATHLWSRIHHLLRRGHLHWVVVGSKVGLVKVHRGILRWCSRRFELLRRGRHLELRLKFCYSRIQVGSNIRYHRIATKNTQK